MSSLFNHAFIPITILLVFSGKLKINPKNILILGFFAILPDTDIILFHRASFHNIFILIIPILAFIITKNREISWIITFYLVSHLILDIFNGGIYLLYPFYDNVVFVRTEIFFDKIPLFDIGISNDIVSTKKMGESIISSENIATTILLMIVTVVSIIKKYKFYTVIKT